MFPFRQLQKNRGTRYLSHTLNENLPRLFGKLYGLQPAINPKTVALLALAYQNLFRATGGRKWEEHGHDCLDWLRQNSRPGYSGRCWGYPFDWQSRSYIPAGTPTAVVTAICCVAFLDGGEIFQNSEYLKIGLDCAPFFLRDLFIDHLDGNRLCFSYTPRDRLHVHNANLWAAYALCRIDAAGGGDAQRKNLVRQAVRYSLQAQHEDGSWEYYGPPDRADRRYVDVYHSGFVLRCLYGIHLLFQDPVILKAICRGYQFFQDHLLIDRQRPRFRDDREYPVDIHACAEAILCSTQLADIIPEAKDTASSVALWTLEHMTDHHGRCYYRKYERRTVKTTYIRWGQAWMFLALARMQRMFTGR